ncbi:MAG TPA: serine hydroxymethyltransferase, partial [Lactobacillus sp.]|nr:serine hydroxymethyltransferase [Lactobacillus sp.]
GGHLTHGSPVNFSGKTYTFHSYGVDPVTERIDYEAVRALAEEIHPRMIVAGASAYSRTIDFAKFREIADAVGAYLMVDMAHIAGLVATGAHPSPVPYADVVTTTTHKTLRGPRGGLILAKADYGRAINSAVFPGTQGGPLEHVIAAKAIAFHEAMQPEFKAYIAQVIKNTAVMADYCNAQPGLRVISGGTDNHLFLLDVTGMGVTGREVQDLCDSIAITLNKNTIPGEKNGPFKTSGVRIGAAAITSRGFKEQESLQVAKWIVQAIQQRHDQAALADIRQQVYALTDQLPITR